MADPADDMSPLLQRALAGDESALAALFDSYRERLRRMVRLRLDRRLSGRVDSSDVLQEAYLDVRNKLIVQEALNSMDPIDREVLALRHFEHLSNDETALVLGLRKSAASNRYIRALKRLKEILSSIPGLREQL
jgi:DNA-directed RNA polymerase specialized sigma24 family protein